MNSLMEINIELKLLNICNILLYLFTKAWWFANIDTHYK